MDLENSTMKTFKIVIRDLHTSIETYVIEAACIAAALKTAKKLWDESHQGHLPVNYAWNEVVETKPQAPELPQPKMNASTTHSLRKAFAPATVVTHKDIQQHGATHSGIFTEVDGKKIELSLVPKSEY